MAKLRRNVKMIRRVSLRKYHLMRTLSTCPSSLRLQWSLLLNFSSKTHSSFQVSFLPSLIPPLDLSGLTSSSGDSSQLQWALSPFQFLLLKTTFDCISKVLMYATFMYVVNNGQFSSMMTLTAFYCTLAVLIILNIIVNDNTNYKSANTWIGKGLLSLALCSNNQELLN